MNDSAHPIQILVNGEARRGLNGQPLLEFIDGLGLTSVGILIERNGVALLRGEWELTRMADGDHLEILRVVAGG